jgi:hypothetical protein
MNEEKCPHCDAEPYDISDIESPNYSMMDDAWLCGSYRPYRMDLEQSPVCEIREMKKITKMSLSLFEQYKLLHQITQNAQKLKSQLLDHLISGCLDWRLMALIDPIAATKMVRLAGLAPDLHVANQIVNDYLINENDLQNQEQKQSSDA